MKSFLKPFIFSWMYILIGTHLDVCAAAVTPKIPLSTYLQKNPEQALKLALHYVIEKNDETTENLIVPSVVNIMYNPRNMDKLFPNFPPSDEHVQFLTACALLFGKYKKTDPWSDIKTILQGYQQTPQNQLIVYVAAAESMIRFSFKDDAQKSYSLGETVDYVMRNSFWNQPFLDPKTTIPFLDHNAVKTIFQNHRNKNFNTIFSDIFGTLLGFPSPLAANVSDTLKQRIKTDVINFWTQHNLGHQAPLASLTQKTVLDILSGFDKTITIVDPDAPKIIPPRITPISPFPISPVNVVIPPTITPVKPAQPIRPQHALKSITGVAPSLRDLFKDSSNDRKGNYAPSPTVYKYHFNALGHYELRRPLNLDAASDALFTECARALKALESIQDSVADIQKGLPKLLSAFDMFLFGTRFNQEIEEAANNRVKYHLSLSQFKPAPPQLSVLEHISPDVIDWANIGINVLKPAGHNLLDSWGFPQNHNDQYKHMFRPFYEITDKGDDFAYFIRSFGYTNINAWPANNYVRFEPNIHVEHLISDFMDIYASNPEQGFTPLEMPKALARMYRETGKLFMEETRRLHAAQARGNSPFIWRPLFIELLVGGCADEYIKILNDYKTKAIQLEKNDFQDIALIGKTIDSVLKGFSNKEMDDIENRLKGKIPTINGKQDFSRITVNDLEVILTKPLKTLIDNALKNVFQSPNPKIYAEALYPLF